MRAWLYIAIIDVGYMVSRGLAKVGQGLRGHVLLMGGVLIESSSASQDHWPVSFCPMCG